MESLAVKLLLRGYNAVLAVLCCCHSRQSPPESAPEPNSSRHQSPEQQESSIVVEDSSGMEILSGLSVENVNPESSEASIVTIEAVETNQLQSRNKHQLKCDNKNALKPPKNSLQQLKAKLNELISENSVLKDLNCFLKTNLKDMTWQQNNLLSERHLLETELRTLQEECYEYRTIAEDALRKNSALEASNEKEMEEVETRLELSEANVARCKANFQQLQTALTAEHMRTAIHAKEEQNARQALAPCNDENRMLKATNVLQQIRIAELEAEIDSKYKKPVRIIPKPVVKSKKRDSKLKRFRTKICTSMKPALNRLGAISPSKMSNWFASPLRKFPI